MLLSIIIPVFNEDKIIKNNLQKIIEYLNSHSWSYEIIISNDGSTDNTIKEIEPWIKLFRNIKIINLLKHKGKGAAVREAIKNANGDKIIFFDADLSTSLSEIENIFQWFNKDFDIIIGSRVLPTSKTISSWYRKLIGKIFNFLTATLVFKSIPDTQCGFKCFTKESAKMLFNIQKIDGFCFDVEILYLAQKYKFKIKQIPIHWVHRPDSKVKIVKDSFYMLIDLFRIKFFDLLKFYDYSPKNKKS